eukprot:jgi/Undpi1/2020/HiC_scaffold_12.g05406.m1
MATSKRKALAARQLRDTCLASATAGLVSRGLCHPLDTAKARLQGPHGDAFKNTAHVLRMTMTNEGVRGLYRGIGAVLVGGIPGVCLYLTTYEAAKDLLADKLPGGAAAAGGEGARGGGSGGIATHLTAGMLAEVFCCVIFVPVDVVKERLQVQQHSGKATLPRLPPVNRGGGADGGAREPPPPYRGSADALKTIMKAEGFRGIYKGYLATLASFGPFSALYFAFYEQAKAVSTRFFAERQGRTLSGRDAGLPSGGGSARGRSDGISVDVPAPVTLANAAAAAAAASWLTNPLDLAKLRLQVQRGAAANASFTRAAGTPGGPTARVDGSARVYTGMVDALMRCYRKEGLAGLFKGSGARMAFHAPSTAIAMATFETTKGFLGTALL